MFNLRFVETVNLPRKNPGRGEGFVTKELRSRICIYPLHPNKNTNFNTFTTKKQRFEGTIL